MLRILSVVLCALIAGAARVHGAELTVSAASSLRDAFTEIARAFEQANPPYRVLLNFAASGPLLQQISRGAPVQVFASADVETMDRAQLQGLIVSDTRTNFARNRLVVVLPSDSVRELRSLADLSDPQFARLGIGLPDSVPAGRYAKQALEGAGKWAALKDRYIYGQNVRQVLDYVARGEVDAGFVYATDAALLKDKVRVAIEAEVPTPILYPIAAVKATGNEQGARRFIDFVRSDRAQRTLAKYGFARP